MKRSILFVATALCISATALAQEDNEQPLSKGKFLDHHIGVQMNGLIRQVFNFNNNNTNNLNNPYLLTYNLNLAKTGWGVRLGLGADFSKFKETDGITDRDNDIQTLNARFGFEKKFNLSNKWSAGAGVDGLWNNENNRTVSKVASFDTTTTDISTKTQTFGGGAMAWLRYNVTDHIAIGTETSFYYTAGKETQEVSIYSTGGNPNPNPFPIIQPTSSTTKIENDVAVGTFSMPVVFYLIVAF